MTNSLTTNTFQLTRLIMPVSFLQRILAVIVCFLLGACADLQTVGRRTVLPVPSEDKQQKQHGIAIHLDAQQRLVLVNSLGQFCAEPSPDALAAYASSFGLSGSVPDQGAASVAQALQSSSGSIGLRTQSITLMRDALFRICEAYLDKSIGPTQVMTLLSRNQDLTAVVLAIEQLTGAVAANQIALTSNASAAASASLLSNQQLLDAARQDEKQKIDERDKAKTVLEERQKATTAKTVEFEAAQSLLDAANKPNSGVSDEEKRKLQADRDTKSKELEALQQQEAMAKADLATKEALVEEATKIRQTIENARDSALTSAIASTGSVSEFSTPIQRRELSGEASKEIARAVESMVLTVLSKEHDSSFIVQACVDLFRNPPTFSKSGDIAALERLRGECLTLMANRALYEGQLLLQSTYFDSPFRTRLDACLGADASGNYTNSQKVAQLAFWIRAADNVGDPAMTRLVQFPEDDVVVMTFVMGREYAHKHGQALQDVCSTQ